MIRRLINVFCFLDVEESREGFYGCDSNVICNDIKGLFNCVYNLRFNGDGNNSCKGD